MSKHQRRRWKKTERLFALILQLQSRRTMNTSELAEYFGVSRRTIFRDIRALSDSGVPISYADQAGYKILEGYRLPPLMLTGRQAATVLVGTELMKLHSDTALRREATDVALKIRSVLPNNVQEYIDRLNERTVLDPYWLHVNTGDDGQFWFKLNDAVAERRSCMMEYYVRSRKELTKRKVDPLGLVYYEDHWNVIAFDHLRADIRNFQLDNIRSLYSLMQRFTPPKGFSVEQYHKDKALHPLRERVKIRFDKAVYRNARRYIPARINDEYESGDNVEVSFYFENMPFLARTMLRYGKDMQILEPESLRSLVHDEALVVAECHADDPSGGH